MKPIRVLQVLTIMTRGGAETMVMNYYRNIDRTKVQFDFLLHRPQEAAFDEEIKALGGRIFRMPPIHPKNKRVYLKKLNHFFQEHPEYKIVHSHLNALSYLVLSVAKQNNVPVRIAHSHIAITKFEFTKLFNSRTNLKAIIKDGIQNHLRHRPKKFANYYFACGEKAGDWLFGNNSREDVNIINNAIDTQKFKFDGKKSVDIRIRLKLENKKIIGHIGRFDEQKNHFFLIEIFKEIAKKDDETCLVLLGEGNLMPKVIEKVKEYELQEKVLFLRVRKDVADIIQSFDIFLFPSLYEGLPLTLIEAQAAGLKTIASDNISKEVDITGLITFLSLKQSAKEWAEVVLENIDHERSFTYQQIVEAGYDIKQKAKELQNFYLNI